MREAEKEFMKAYITNIVRNMDIRKHKHCKECGESIDHDIVYGRTYDVGRRAYALGVCVKCIALKGLEYFMPRCPGINTNNKE